MAIEIPKQFGDITAKQAVQIIIGETGLVTWINIDGVCALRILTHGMLPIVIQDSRSVKDRAK